MTKKGKLSQQGIERLKLKYQISIFSVEVLKEVQAIFKDPKRSKTKLKKSLDVGKRFSKGRITWDAQDDTLIVLEQILECINNVFPEKGSLYSWTEKLTKENTTLNVKDVTTEFSDTMHIRDIASNVFSGLQKRCQKTENEPLANGDILTEERTLVKSAPDICFFSLVFRRQFVVIDENEPICTAKCVKDFDIEKTLDIRAVQLINLFCSPARAFFFRDLNARNIQKKIYIYMKFSEYRDMPLRRSAKAFL